MTFPDPWVKGREMGNVHGNSGCLKASCQILLQAIDILVLRTGTLRELEERALIAVSINNIIFLWRVNHL